MGLVCRWSNLKKVSTLKRSLIKFRKLINDGMQLLTKNKSKVVSFYIRSVKI